MPGALPDTTLPIYPGLGQAPNMLACIPGDLVAVYLSTVKNEMLEAVCQKTDVFILCHIRWDSAIILAHYEHNNFLYFTFTF